MAVAYSKELIIEAALYRFKQVGLDSEELREIYNRFYDEFGKDKFRTYACVTPEAIRVYKQAMA